MEERRLETENGVLCYERRGDKIDIVRCLGAAGDVRLPASIEGCPIVRICSRAFLGQKRLYAITCPDLLQEVGDWAFSGCSSLSWISFPKREVRFGRAVFKGCDKLERIEVRRLEGASQGAPSAPELPTVHVRAGERAFQGAPSAPELLTVHVRVGERASQGAPSAPELLTVHGGAEKRVLPGSQAVPELLAAAVVRLDAGYLLDLQAAGEAEWLEKWDARLFAILHASDQEGYFSQTVCGEEDYRGMEQEAFASERRKEKVRFAFLRLLHPKGLAGERKRELEQYLQGLTKGQQGEEAWQVIREEHGRDREYYQLFVELGCVREDNLEGILADLGEECPEMKAYFLKRQGAEGGAEAFFGRLEL